jgi:heme-degrading monooxygenase HmoA
MPDNPIQLHVDLEVDPAKESELEKTFHSVFEPTISRQPGFVSVTLLKARASGAHRLVISFQTEEHRVTWVGTADHQAVWPQMEAHLRGAKFAATLWQTL